MEKLIASDAGVLIFFLKGGFGSRREEVLRVICCKTIKWEESTFWEINVK